MADQNDAKPERDATVYDYTSVPGAMVPGAIVPGAVSGSVFTVSITDLVQLVEKLIQAPPTDEELRLLTEVAEEAEAQDLSAEQVEARLGDSRLLELLKLLWKQDTRIAAYLTLLLMIVQLVSDRNPPKDDPAPAPQVTVTVTVPVEEIIERVVDEAASDDIPRAGGTVHPGPRPE